MAKLIEVPLCANGLTYIRSCLRQGTGLSAVLDRSVVSNGFVFSPLPDGVTVDRASQFNAGGLLRMSDSRRWLKSHLINKCKYVVPSSIIIQDVWAKPTDPMLKSAISTVLLSKNEVYYLVNGTDIEEKKLTDALKDVASFLLVGVLAKYSVSEDFTAKGSLISDEIVEEIAENTIEVFVSAYDQEGIVIWRKAGRSS